MDISALLPLIQMMSGNKNMNMADILNNPAMSGMFKNTGGNSDMLSALMSMMAGGGFGNKNSNKNTGNENPGGENTSGEKSDNDNPGSENFADIFKNIGNTGGNNNILSMLPLIQSMMGNKSGSNPDMLKMLPLIQSMIGQQGNRSRRQKQKAEPPESKNRFYNLKPISKIANKDITYILNQYFAG